MTELTETVTALVAAATALAGFSAAVWRTLRRAVRKLDALEALPAKVTALEAQSTALEALVTKELTHNHGSSIKDDVVGLAVGMGHMARTQDRHAVELGTLRADLSNLKHRRKKD